MKNKAIRALVDLDGVMSDFSTQYHKINGFYPVDIYGSHQLMSAEEKALKDELFDRYIDRRGFLYAPLIPDARDLIVGLHNLQADGLIHAIEFCTSAGGKARATEVDAQKRAWLKLHGFDHIHAHIVTTGKKKIDVIDNENYHDILIDDTKFVVDYFAANGGISILHTSAKTSLNLLMETIRALK